MGALIIFLKEMLFFKKRFWHITSASLVTPSLYLIAFGWGVGKFAGMEKSSYAGFVIPGIIALTGMHVSYSSVSMRVNIGRVHEHSFESYLVSPLPLSSLITGYLMTGMVRGMYSVFLVYLMCQFIDVNLSINGSFLMLCLLNTAFFSLLGYSAAVLIDNHYDMNNFSNYVITPMAFLCGTFFAVESLPSLVRDLVSLLPLTQVSMNLRLALRDEEIPFTVYIILILSILLMGWIGACFSKKNMY